MSSVAELLHGYADVHRALRMPVCNARVDATEYLRRLGLAMSRSKLDRLNIHLEFAATPCRSTQIGAGGWDCLSMN